MKLTNEQLVRGIDLYRKTVEGRHGPVSLDDFRAFLEDTVGHGLTKSGLSVRLNSLVNEGYLDAVRDERWGLRTFTLEVTEKGRKLLENGDDVEEAREASG